MPDNNRTYEVSEDQMKYLIKHSYICGKKIGDKFFIYLMLLGGATERFTKQYLQIP